MNKHFREYNPNPNKAITTDCTIRAYTKAFGCTWVQAYHVAIREGIEDGLIFNDIQAIKNLMEKIGAEYVGVKVPKGSKRPTGQTLARTHQNDTLILRSAGHIATMENGVVYDTWNSADRSLYNYWVIDEKTKQNFLKLIVDF